MKKMPFSDPVLVATISTAGGLGIAYITNVLAKRKKERAPKNRIEGIFDGYDKLIAQQQEDNDRKSDNIDQLQELIDTQRRQLNESQIMITALKDELEEAKGRNQELRDQLAAMKREYANQSTADQVANLKKKVR